MAHHNNTPASVLSVQTPTNYQGILSTAVLIYDSGNGIPARRIDLLKGEGKTLTRTPAKYVPAW